MKYSLLESMASLRRFCADRRGGVAVYTAFLSFLAVGAGALALDFGRVSVLRSQTQNRADAGALAAAAQLDGRAGAQSRANAVAINATSQSSAISSDGALLDVSQVNFFSQVDPSKVVATGDEDSRFAEVILNPRRINYILAPILGHGAPNSGTLQTTAIAGSSPFICQAPPLMICDPGELDMSQSLSNLDNAGREILLKPPPSGGSAWAPGNYGLLALPDGSIGASSIEAALAAVQPEECYALDVSTAPGVKTAKVQNGINARFDLDGGLPDPAPNVINYPMDPEIEADLSINMGSGNWDVDAYWNAKHGSSAPAALAGASRYQTYLYELGLEYGRDGRKTIYPVDEPLPGGYVLITPPGPNIPVDPANPDDPDFDGVPSQPVASNGYARRLAKIAVLQCQASGVSGAHTYPTSGNFVEAFITQTVADAPEGGIFIELVRPLTTTNTPDFHANVRLVE